MKANKTLTTFIDLAVLEDADIAASAMLRPLKRIDQIGPHRRGFLQGRPIKVALFAPIIQNWWS